MREPTTLMWDSRWDTDGQFTWCWSPGLYTWLLFRWGPGMRTANWFTTSSAQVDTWSSICLAEYWGMREQGCFISPDTDSQSIYFPSHFHYCDIYGSTTFDTSMYLCWNAVKAWNWELEMVGSVSLGLDFKFSGLCFWLKGNINFRASWMWFKMSVFNNIHCQTSHSFNIKLVVCCFSPPAEIQRIESIHVNHKFWMYNWFCAENKTLSKNWPVWIVWKLCKV